MSQKPLIQGIERSNGKIYIPLSMFDKKDRNKIPGIRWSNQLECWYAYESSIIIKKVNELFDTTFEPIELNRLAIQYPYKTEPYAHQLAALDHGCYKPSFAYLMEQGTGKTKVLIDNAQILNRDDGVNGLLVVCPKTVIGAWVREINLHGHFDLWKITRWDYGVIHKPNNGPIMNVLIINIDALVTDKGFNTAKGLLMMTRGLMVVDESTLIKNINALRTKKIMALGNYAKYKRILTGTPIAHSPMDIYSQFHFLDPWVFFGWSFWAFRSHFAVMGGYKDKEIIDYKNQDELTGIISPFSYRITKIECLDLPAKIYEQRDIILNCKTAKAYDQIKRNMIKQICQTHNVRLSLPYVLQKIMKLRQLTGGFLRGDLDADEIIKENKVVMLDRVKIDETISIINDTNGKVIVWCQFKHEIDAIKKTLDNMNIKNVEISGRITGVNRDMAIQKFEDINSDTMVVLCQNDAGSLGITLIAAHTVVFYSNSNKYNTRVQAEDRSHRSGLTHHVTYIDLIAPGTIDQTLINAFGKKKDLADMILNSLSNQTPMAFLEPLTELLGPTSYKLNI